MYLNPPADPRGPADHVVVDTVTTEVWGPYRKGAATSARRKMKEQHPAAPRGRFAVRKMKRST